MGYRLVKALQMDAIAVAMASAAVGSCYLAGNGARARLSDERAMARRSMKSK